MGEILRRNIFVVNLDPAAETFNYKCDIGIYINEMNAINYSNCE